MSDEQKRFEVEIFCPSEIHAEVMDWLRTAAANKQLVGEVDEHISQGSLEPGMSSRTFYFSDFGDSERFATLAAEALSSQRHRHKGQKYKVKFDGKWLADGLTGDKPAPLAPEKSQNTQAVD